VGFEAILIFDVNLSNSKRRREEDGYREALNARGIRKCGLVLVGAFL